MDTVGRHRDTDWFRQFFDAHHKAVARFFARRVDRNDVDDLTADVFVIAWRRRADVPAAAELPWLYRTAGFLLANHRRKMRPIPVEVLPEEPDMLLDSDPLWAAIRDDEVRTALQALSPRDRSVLLLHAWDGLAGDDLAAALGISRSAADSALSRARARLRKTWEEAPADTG